MKAYSCGITKDEFVAETIRHRELDNFLKGVYWNPYLKKGCAVGCAIDSINNLKDLNLNKDYHKQYEEFLGIPEWLARVEDVIFEGLPLNEAKNWPILFAEAINTGANLDKIKIDFIVYILEQNIAIQEQLLKNNPLLKSVINDVISTNRQMIKAQKTQNEKDLQAAKSAAESATKSAARSAAWSAWSAVGSARSAAESVAWSAVGSARSAAWSVTKSAAWSAVWLAAESAAWVKYANKLLQLLRDCK